MVFRVIDPSVVGVDDPLCAPALLAQCVYIAFFVIAFRKDSFIISEIVSAYAFAGRVRLQRTALPSELLRGFLCDKIGRQLSISMNIQRYIFFCCVASVFRYGLPGILRAVFLPLVGNS